MNMEIDEKSRRFVFVLIPGAGATGAGARGGEKQ